jgi:hypothetical protein
VQRDYLLGQYRAGVGTRYIPGCYQGETVEDDSEVLFTELFLHVVNFVERERSRRPGINWQYYALPKSRGWKTIG